MQRIYPTALTPNDYRDSQGHQQIIPESVCPNCVRGSLHRHGVYDRWISWLGQAISIFIARFLCSHCRRTVSYLPAFALSYRVVNTATVQAFFDGQTERAEVQSWLSLLQSYRRRREAFAPELIGAVGSGLGLAPPAQGPLWPWLKKACGSLESATRQLVSEFKITLFNRYQCHQPRRC